MKSKIKTEVIVILELNQEEALWLRNVMQNPINNATIEDESEEDGEMRETFFQYLPSKESF